MRRHVTGGQSRILVYTFGSFAFPEGSCLTLHHTFSDRGGWVGHFKRGQPQSFDQPLQDAREEICLQGLLSHQTHRDSLGHFSFHQSGVPHQFLYLAVVPGQFLRELPNQFPGLLL